MNIKIEVGEDDLKKLVIAKFQELVNADLSPADVKIEVKSKQNYKSEWEQADFRATVNYNS